MVLKLACCTLMNVYLMFSLYGGSKGITWVILSQKTFYTLAVIETLQEKARIVKIIFPLIHTLKSRIKTCFEYPPQ